MRLLPALLLAGLTCSQPGALTLRAQSTPVAPGDPLPVVQSLDERVAAVSYHLATANNDLCDAHIHWAGLSLHDLNQYFPAYRAQARAEFGLDDTHPGILAVVRDGPAFLAGLKPGDRVLSIAGQSVEHPLDVARADYASIAKADALLTASASGPLQIEVSGPRGGRSVVIDGVDGCASRAEMVPGDSLEASADGMIVQISSAMAEMAQSDDELAIVLGHEMAHNVLHHRQALDAAHVSRGLLAGYVGGGRLRESERQADEFGLYLAARAGYDVSVANAFWHRVRLRSDLGFLAAPTHPAWPERLRQIAQVVADIEDKKARGQPLTPPPMPPL